MWLGKTFFLFTLPVISLVFSFFFEQIRWFVLLKGRRELLKKCYHGETEEILGIGARDHSKSLVNEDDLLMHYGKYAHPKVYPEVLGPSMDIDKYPGKQISYDQQMFYGRFVNPFWEFCDRNPANIIRYTSWRLLRRNRNDLEVNQGPDAIDYMTVVNPDLNLINSWQSSGRKDSPEILLTWLGQSTCLIQMEGYNILTDPVFGDNLISSFFGPKRATRAPLKFQDIPSIDIVLVSHDHFDHLERGIAKLIGNSALWIVPAKLGKCVLEGLGVTRYRELSWWQRTTFRARGCPEIVITSTPTQHWSGTHFFNVNSTLWGSMFVKGPNCSFFHCGDTSYCSVFKEIFRRLGSPNLALLPIGTYEPRWYLKYDHISPWEAIQIHKDIHADKSFAVHWGSYKLSDEPFGEPPMLLKIASEKSNLSPDEFLIRNIGSTVLLNFGPSPHAEDHFS